MRPAHRPTHGVARLLATLLATALAAGACGPTGPATPAATSSAATLTATPAAATPGASSTSPSPASGPSATAPPDAAYADIERQVEQLRGLTATHPVDPRLIDEAGLRAYTEKALASILPGRVAASGALLRALGLLPADADLGALFTELFTTQVAGFYDPETKELYVVSKKGGLGPIEKVTFAHEFTHALQDQRWPHFGGTEFQGAMSGIVRLADGDSDRSLGELALIEGDPTVVMALWSQRYLSPLDLLQLVAASTDPQTARILDAMPAILRETLMYPYLAGLQFVLARQLSGGWPAVDALYANPPVSTEQVLHPEAYPNDRPIPVTLPAGLAARMGAGWTTVQQDTLGELQLRVWLEAGGGPAWKPTADAAAAGWGGDRVELVRGPDGTWALILKTAWDRPADAREFNAGATATIGTLGLTGRVLPGAGGTEVDVVLGSDAATMARLANVLGLAG